MSDNDEILIKGSPLSEGLAIGKAVILSSGKEESIAFFCEEHSEVDQEIDQEIERYRSALFSSRKDLHRLQDNLADQGSFEAVEIIDSHIEMLKDPFMTTQMEKKIRESSKSSESVFRSVIAEYEERFSKRGDIYFKQRLTDIMDLAKRILNHLRPQDIESAINYAEAIIFSEELNIAHVAEADSSTIVAFVVRKGGGQSHAALIAKAKGIPAVSSIDWEKLPLAADTQIIVDGNQGLLILNPSEETLLDYREWIEEQRVAEQNRAEMLKAPLETTDHHPIELYANVSQLEEMTSLVGTQGVGLLRTEVFFLGSEEIPSEEEQFQIYREVFDRAQGVVTVRLFDFGQDKIPKFYCAEKVKDHLGGIAFLLNEQEILRSQLRALLCAGKEMTFQILLPMISDLEEVREIKKIIYEEMRSIDYPKLVEIGCMIETPSAALICDLLAKECDFFSIGTNDLLHYLIGSDRCNDNKVVPPSFFRLLDQIVREADRCNTRVCLCGDLASNPLYLPLLLAFGITSFSVPSRKIPLVRETIFSTSFQSIGSLKKEILKTKPSSEIHQRLNQIIS